MTAAYITGGAGLIGSFIARQLIEDRVVDSVVLLDHFGRYVDSLKETFVDYRRLRFVGIEDKIVVERGDGSSHSVVYQTLKKHRPRYVIHLAALPLAKLPNLNPEEAQQGSIETTVKLIDSINQLKQDGGPAPERFVYASSSMVYGDFQTEVATEEHPTNPKEIYGTMKLAGEVVTRGLCQFYDIPFSIVRPSAVYGPTDMNRRVTQIFVEKAIFGEKITVHGQNEALDFTFVKDAAKGFVLAATKLAAVGETFNITLGRAHTLLDFVKGLQKHFPNLRYEVTERDAFRPKRGTLSIDKARRLLGYEPQYPLQRGIDEYVAFVRKHHPLANMPERAVG